VDTDGFYVKNRNRYYNQVKSRQRIIVNINVFSRIYTGSIKNLHSQEKIILDNSEPNVYRFGIQRKIVAQMTSESWKSVPHVSYVFRPHMSDFLKAYKKWDDELAKEGKHVTINTVMLKAICDALKEAPQLNAHIHFEPRLVRGKVTILNSIDISMPWKLPDGKMMTITMKDMGSRSLGNITEYMEKTQKRVLKTNLTQVMYDVSMQDTFEKLRHGRFISTAMRLIGSKTNKKHRVEPLKGEAKKAYDAIPDSEKLTKDDLKQGSITISNIGAMTRGHDGELVLLMIVPPQVCAIGISSLVKIPIIKKNEKGEDYVGIEETIPLDIVFDHRVLDFGDIKPFLDALQKILDNPDDFLKYDD